MSAYDRSMLLACTGAIIISNGNSAGLILGIGGMIGMFVQFMYSSTREQRDTDDA